MRTILIADAGSTKTDWVAVSSERGGLKKLGMPGLNAMLVSPLTVSDHLLEVNSVLGPVVPDEIYFYGAGCATESVCEEMRRLFLSIWPGASVEVYSDMLGAARGLLGQSKGIACILGTGSNSCLYDGTRIVDQIPSLGYVLGDEGSGNALGRRLLTGMLKRQFSKELTDKFTGQFNLTAADVLQRVYRTPEPNRYLASFVPFISSNLLEPEIYSMVVREFSNFAKRNIAPYAGARSLPVAFTGSIASVFEKLLREGTSAHGLKISKVENKPLGGMVRYHVPGIHESQIRLLYSEND